MALAFIATLTNDPSDRHVFVSFQDTFYHQKGGTLQDVSQHVCGKGPNSAPGNRGTVSKWLHKQVKLTNNPWAFRAYTAIMRGFAQSHPVSLCNWINTVRRT